MSKQLGINLRDSMTPALLELTKKVKDLSRPMRDIERQVMRPLKERAWKSSGLKKESGDLRDSVKTFSGKKSAGVGLKAQGLVAGRAVLLNQGAKKNQYRRKRKIKIRAHSRQGRAVAEHTRRNNGSPWGKIKKSQFIPSKLSGSDEKKIFTIMEKYIVPTR